MNRAVLVANAVAGSGDHATSKLSIILLVLGEAIGDDGLSSRPALPSSPMSTSGAHEDQRVFVRRTLTVALVLIGVAAVL